MVSMYSVITNEVNFVDYNCFSEKQALCRIKALEFSCPMVIYQVITSEITTYRCNKIQVMFLDKKTGKWSFRHIARTITNLTKVKGILSGKISYNKKRYTVWNTTAGKWKVVIKT